RSDAPASFRPNRCPRSSSTSSGLAHPPGEELTLELPGLVIRLQRFAEPAERLWRDLRERPTDRGAVGVGADLDNVLAAPTPDQPVPRACPRIDPGHPPGLDRRVPDAKCGAIRVALVQLPGALRPPGYDPDVLYGAALEHPGEMGLALDAARGHVNPVMTDLQRPAADEPPIHICRPGNLG